MALLSNISVITEGIYLKLRLVVYNQKGTHTSRADNPPNLEFSKSSCSRAVAPACNALVKDKLSKTK